MAQPNYRGDILQFLDTFMLCEGSYGPRMVIPPFLADFLRRCFPQPDGDPVERNIIDSRSKKQGKSALAAGIALYQAVRKSYSEVVIAAADKDQAKDRVLRACKFPAENGPLKKHVKVTRDCIEFSNNSSILAVPMDWRGASGGNYDCVIFDELHSYTLEYQSRLFDELVIPPTAKVGVRWLATYAGFLGESNLLWDWWQKALAGDKVSDDPPMYHNRDAGLFAMLDQGEASWRMPWNRGPEGARYMAQVQASERPNTYRRLWLNEWVSPEGEFVKADEWDALLDPDLRPAEPGVPIWFGADASVKHDCTALVGVTYNEEKKRAELAYCRVWNPSQLGRLDPDKTIGDELRALYEKGHNIAAIYADPWQMETCMQRLAAEGFNVVDFPQGSARTESDQGLWTAIAHRTLAVYPEPDLRKHVLNAVAIEGVRGMRLAKEKTTQKIDAAVALSMAHHAATIGGNSGSCLSWYTAEMIEAAGETIDWGDEVTTFRTLW